MVGFVNTSVPVVLLCAVGVPFIVCVFDNDCGIFPVLLLYVGVFDNDFGIVNLSNLILCLVMIL